MAILLALMLILLSLDSLNAGLAAAKEGDKSNGKHGQRSALAAEVIVTVSIAQTEPFLVNPIPGLLVSIVDPAKRNETHSGLVGSASTNKNGISAFIIPEGRHEIRLGYSGLESNVTINSGLEQRRVHVDWVFVRQPLEGYLIELHDDYRDGLVSPGDTVGISFPSSHLEETSFLEVYFSGPGGVSVGASPVARSVATSTVIHQSRVATFQVIESSASGEQVWARASPLSSLRAVDLLRGENPTAAAYWLLTQVTRIPMEAAV